MDASEKEERRSKLKARLIRAFREAGKANGQAPVGKSDEEIDAVVARRLDEWSRELRKVYDSHLRRSNLRRKKRGDTEIVSPAAFLKKLAKAKAALIDLISVDPLSYEIDPLLISNADFQSLSDRGKLVRLADFSRERREDLQTGLRSVETLIEHFKSVPQSRGQAAHFDPIRNMLGWLHYLRMDALHTYKLDAQSQNDLIEFLWLSADLPWETKRDGKDRTIGGVELRTWLQDQMREVKEREERALKIHGKSTAK